MYRIRLDGVEHQAERRMIYEVFDGILAGYSMEHLLQLVWMCYNSTHIRSEVRDTVAQKVQLHFTKKNPRTDGNR